MKLKKILSLLIIISLILIIPSSSAANEENNQDQTGINTLINSYEDTLGKINNFFRGLFEESIDVHGYDELAEIIDKKSNENKSKTYIINLEDGDYNITHSIKIGNEYSSFKINGNNHIIDGNNKKQFMEVYGNLEVNNLTIKNTKYQKNESSAICMIRNSELKINNCTFQNNHGNIKGGAITCRGKTKITGSEFINNTCEETGGAIWSTGEYGGTLILENNTFKQNIANAKENHERTSVVYTVSRGDNIIENNIFENNTGRCIHSYMYTSTKIINNTFQNNKLAFNEVIRGGIIDNYESDITIQDNKFVNNKIKGELRGGLLYHEIGHLEFVNNTIKDKHVQTGNITNETCSKGGLIFNRNATANIRDNTFKNVVNANMTWGGVIYNNMGDIQLINNKFANKVIGEHIKGMAIYNDVNAKTTVSNNTFKTKYNGSIDTQNQEDKYIYNSDVKNSEGKGTRGITIYEK